MNHREKLGAASFILVGEIRNRTNKHAHIHIITNKYVRLRGLTYIHTCPSYVHTPRELDRHVVESPTGTFIVPHAQADSSDFGLLEKQKFTKM